MKKSACKFALVALGFLLPTLTAQAQDTERRWDLQFAGFFRDGQEPLYVYARERNGDWLAVVGSSRGQANPNRRTYNQSYYCGDLSAAPVKDGKVKGRFVLHMTPDHWVPLDHKPYTIELAVDASVSKENKVEGTYKVTAVNSTDKTAEQFKGKTGAISGVTKPPKPLELPAQFTLPMKLQGALVGGDPRIGDRCLVVRLGYDGGKIVAAEQGRLNEKQGMYGFAAFELAPDAVKITADGFKGRCVVSSRTLDEEPAKYTIDIDGHLLDAAFVGTYQLAVAVAGKEPVNLAGSFDGRWSEGVTAVAAKPDNRPWWTPVKDFQTVQAGEHPRLLFRKSDLPALRKKAETPEGKAMIARLRAQLNGGDGETLPTSLNKSLKAYTNKEILPLGTYTMSHAAGYGLLYQLTGDKKYADLGKQCFELALKGQRDRDDRYSWKDPNEALRAGPMLGFYALGYDLCYDGWDEATRAKFGKAIANYHAGLEESDTRTNMDLETLVRGSMPPASNHYGMQVGGAALALLAVTGEKWVDQKRIDTLLKVSESSMIRNMTEGFGDGGFFAEGDGTGSMSSHIVFLTALQAWKHSLGKDFISVDRPNARMMALKWLYLTVVRDGKPDFWPIRGAYGHNVWSRELSGQGYCAIGMGAVTPEQQAALKWYYNRYLLAGDTKANAPFDTVSNYPHVTVSAFVNWPVEMKERNPAEVLPLCYRDSIYGFYAWRNRWQDDNDVVISVLTQASAGYMKATPDGGLQVAAFGKKFKWGQVGGEVKYWWTSTHGEASVLTTADGKSVAVDFTRGSGADAMLVTTGQAEGQQVKLGPAVLTFKFLTAGKEPTVKVDGDKAIVGKQTVSIKDGNIVLGVTAVK